MAYSNFRKTSKQIYRILSNQHYPHLRNLLREIEFSLSKGIEQPKIIRTNSPKDFHSSISELLLANFFAKNGFHVSSFDGRKGNSPVPDIHLSHGELSVIAEVYSPLNWDGFGLFFDELNYELKNLDSPFDFDYQISYELIKHLDSNFNLLMFDPWRFSDSFRLPSERLSYIFPLLEKVQFRMENSLQSGFKESISVESCNTVINIELKKIKKSKNDVLNRSGVLLSSLSGYAPEGMFRNLIKRGVKEKDKKNQVGSILGNHYRVLIVDVSGLGYLSSFENEFYLEAFDKALLEEFPLNTMNADLLLFAEVNVEPSKLFSYLYSFKEEIPTKLGKIIFSE